MQKYTLLAIFLISSFCTIGCSDNLPAEELFNKGKVKLKEGKPKEAYIYFKKAVKKDPEKPEYYLAVASVAPDKNEALIHTKGAWDNGLKTRRVLLNLIALSFYGKKQDNLEYSLSLYQQLPDSSKSDEFRGQIFFINGAYDSSIAIWNKLFEVNPTGSMGSKLAASYMKKRDKEGALSILSYCRERKLLNVQGYILLAALYAFEYDYQEVELVFNEAKKLGYYNDTLQFEQANFYIVQGMVTETESLLSNLKIPVNNEKDNIINHKSRIILSYLYGGQKKRDKIEEIIKIIPDDSPLKSDEVMCHRAIIKSMIDTIEALEDFKNALKKLPPNPIIAILYAQENAKKRNFKEVIEIYKKLPGVYKLSPFLLTKLAQAYSITGDDEKALAALNVLHSKKHFTKMSVELFRDITFKMNLVEKSKAAQSLLDKKFGNDASVRWSSAVLALKTGEIDSAIELLNQLYKDYPDAHRIEIARLSAFLIKKDYNAAVEECKNTKAPFKLYAPVLARAFKKLGKTKNAEKVYKKLLKEDKKPGTMLEYSDFLLKSGKSKEASIVLDELLHSNEQLWKENPKGNALVLNNYAWSLMQENGYNKKTVLSAAKKAYELAPDNKHIVDTYVDILTQSKKYRQCIKLLENNQLTRKEPKLLYYLAVCFERTKDINKAVRTYKEVIEMYNSENILPMTINKNKLKKHVSQLESL